MEEKEKIKSLSPLVNQICLKKLGMFCSERLSVDLYFLMEAVNLLLLDLGENYVKKEYELEYGKDSWDILKKRMNKLNILLAESKSFYDAIQDKTLIKKKAFDSSSDREVQKTIKKFFFKTASKISLIQEHLYKLFIFLVKISTIQRQQIKSEYFMILDQRENRKVMIDGGRREQPQQGYGGI